MIWHPEQTVKTAAVNGSRWDLALAGAVLFAAITLAFGPIMQILVGQWMTNDTYSFGVLVPMISVSFIWMQRDRLQQLSIESSPWIGMSLVLICSALLVAGRVIGVVGVQEAAMVLMVPSTIWLLLGRRYVLALWFPLVYLFLMLPIWEVVTDRFHYRFQLFSALLGQQLLTLVGIPVHRHDTYLELPNITLEVASVCSGVNFLIAVIAIGVPQAYLFLIGAWPRAFVIGFAVAVAIFSNGLRIAIIGVLSHYQLSASTHGPGHVLQGLFVSTAGIIALQIAVSYMSHRYPKPRKPAPPDSGRVFVRVPRWQLLTAVSAAVLVLMTAASAQPSALVAASIDDTPQLPSMEAAWPYQRQQQPMRFVVGGPTPNMGRAFQLTPRETVSLFTGNLTYAEPDGTLGYRRVEITSPSAASETPVQTHGGIVYVITTNFRNGDGETEVAYWYHVDGKVVSQVTTAKLNALWKLFIGGKPLPQLVVITRTRSAGGNEAGQPMSVLVTQVLEALSRPNRANGEHSD